MLSPKKPRHRGRSITEVVQDVKADFKRSRNSRRIKRSLKGNNTPKAEKAVVDRREERRKKLEQMSNDKKWGTNKFSREDKSELKDKGIKVNKQPQIVPTARANRAKRTLGRMDEQDKRRLRRKLR